METWTSVRGKLFTSVWTVLLPIWQPSLHSRMSGSANQLAWHCCLLSISVFSIRGPNTNVDLLPMFMPLNGGFLTWGHPKSSQIRPWPWLSIETHGDLGTSKTILRNLEIKMGISQSPFPRVPRKEPGSALCAPMRNSSSLVILWFNLQIWQVCKGYDLSYSCKTAKCITYYIYIIWQ